ncbi:BID domain-containing T4SS effector [Bartonella sp. CB169]|uniref:BID domain-containing T4SS effector n=1 Tax=Bartonella sp. CB169 TaxID=3112257 RepID=UPI00300E0CE0
MKKNPKSRSASPVLEGRQEPVGSIDRAIYKQLTERSRNFFYPNSSVFKNKYNIRNLEILQQRSANDVEKAATKLREEAPPKSFDSNYLRHIHKCLFQKTFEWAGQTRDESFTFADGTVAFMPFLKRKESKAFFAAGRKIQEGLQDLDAMLVKKNNLKGLTRDEFIKDAVKVMANLHHLHPFRVGSKRVEQIFIEKLAHAAGHKLDFSCVTRKRKMFVRSAAMEHGDLEPMEHLFQDISDPERLNLLSEFTESMREIGLGEKNYAMAVVAQSGLTYHGIYRGSGKNGFALDVKGTYVVGDKRDLKPEQIKKLKVGDRISFTASNTQNLQEMLIPPEKVSPLTREEIAERIRNDASVQRNLQQIRTLCRVVYGNPHALENALQRLRIPATNQDIVFGEKFARNVGAFPGSVSSLAGFKICGLRTNARAHAEENILPLSHAIYNYVHGIKNAEESILYQHNMEQARCMQSVKTPTLGMKELFNLSKEQQQEVLLASPELQMQVNNYMWQLHDRLSPSQREDIKRDNCEELAKSIGTSVNQAKEIIRVFRSGEEIKQNLQLDLSSPSKLDMKLKQGTNKMTKESSAERHTKTLGKPLVKLGTIPKKVVQQREIKKGPQRQRAYTF